ncbi:MAG: hypothetical protein AAFQ43_10660 [Bacteroidota bacterium]
MRSRFALLAALAVSAAEAQPLVYTAFETVHESSPVPDESVRFGWDVVSMPDLDGDGVDEFGAVSTRALSVFSGADSGLVYEFVFPGSSRFGVTLALIGDVTGDGTADVWVGGTMEWDPGAYVVDGATGSLVRWIDSPGGEVRFGAAAAGVPDQDGDGVPDILAGSPAADGEGGEFSARP